MNPLEIHWTSIRAWFLAAIALFLAAGCASHTKAKAAAPARSDAGAQMDQAKTQAVAPMAVFGTPGIQLQPFTMNHRQGADSVINLSFLLEAPAGRDGFIRVQGSHLIKPDGRPIRFWGFNLTEWSRGSVEIPPKEDAPMWAATLARFGVNLVRLHFLDLAAPRGMIDATRDDTQHFDLAQLDKEDFFISELLKRGIYVDLNLNVGRGAKAGDNVLVVQNRIAKGPLLFDKRLIELEKDYARQLLTHTNPYTKRAYADEPGVAMVEIVNEDAIYPGWSANNAYDQELTDLYNAWLQKNLGPEKLGKLRELAGAADDQPVPRLKGAAIRNAPKERYYTECEFFGELESGFFLGMRSYLKDTLKVKCPVIATADHSHSGSGYPLVADTSRLDIVDGHTYWQHPGERDFKNAPMVNDPFNSTVVELSRTAVAGKPYTVSEVNHPFPNQFASEGIPILAAYAGFLDWSAVVWYTFEPKRDPTWSPFIGDPFDMSLDPIKMPQMAAGALMFIRGDLEPAKQTIERSYSREQVLDSRLLPATERPYFTPGFPLATPLLHGSRIGSLAGEPTAALRAGASSPFRSDTGQLVWRTNSEQGGLVTIDSPRSQGLVGFVKANHRRVSNLAADVTNDFCAIVVNSLEPTPISRARRMLLTACARVENTGLQWDARQAHLTEQGRSPTVIEPVTGTITLRNLEHAVKVTAEALDGSGRPIGAPIIARKTAAGWKIPVGKPATTWYEVSVER
ncbi:MAG: hypothetical protein ABSH38_02945 [Verrucomicrobiota bacterium]|jgi:hypothetical protein